MTLANIPDSASAHRPLLWDGHHAGVSDDGVEPTAALQKRVGTNPNAGQEWEVKLLAAYPHETNAQAVRARLDFERDLRFG